MSRQEWLYYDFYIVFSRSKYEWCSGKLKINLTVCTFCSLWFWSLCSVQSMYKMRVECTQTFGVQNQTVSFPKHFLFLFFLNFVGFFCMPIQSNFFIHFWYFQLWIETNSAGVNVQMFITLLDNWFVWKVIDNVIDKKFGLCGFKCYSYSVALWPIRCIFILEN